jgi:hypothetical protein
MAEDNPEGTEGGGNNGHQPATEQHPVATAIESLERQFDSARNNPTQDESQAHFWTIWTGRGVLIYTVFTAVIMIASICSAIFAQRSAQAAHESYISTQRAFITVNELSIVPEYSVNDPTNFMGWTFAPVIENSGSTPTKFLKLVVRAQPQGPASDPESLYPSGTKIRMLVGPKSKVTVPATPDSGLWIPNGSILWAAKGQTTVYVFGAIHYDDVFENTPEHITDYCFQIEAKGDGSPSTKISYRFCPRWNCADDECKADK